MALPMTAIVMTAVVIGVAMICVASLFLTGKVNESAMDHVRAAQCYTASCVIAWCCAFVSAMLVVVGGVWLHACE